MRKFILVFILSIIFIVFLSFLYNAYIKQKEYFENKNKTTKTDQVEETKTLEKPSTYTDYSKVEYDKALSENRVTVLFFTSNWCNKCTQQDKVNTEVFNELDKEGVVALRIYILDSQTTTETDALAKKFDVTKENSFVILDKKGAVALKYIGEITKEALSDNIVKVGDLK